MKIDYLGVGVGLRRPHFDQVIQDALDVDWFELVTENIIDFGGRPKEVVSTLMDKNYPMICHGLGLSIGDPFTIDKEYLGKLRELLKWTKSKWFSDHLCFSSVGKVHYHDLIPVLRTSESLIKIADKINYIQDYIQLPFAVENISYYHDADFHEMSEVEFINRLIDKTNCSLLLDINNTYVNSLNFNFDALKYLENVNYDQVIQIHIAGHEDRGDIVIDTHGAKTCLQVWDLYRYVLSKANRKISTLIEWDHSLPSYEILNEEVIKAKSIVAEVFDET